MGKKMKLPFLLNNTADVKASWSWPSCNQPRTLSFRNNSEIFKTINSAFLDATVDALGEKTTDPSLFTNSSSDSTSLSTASEDSRRGEDPIETVIRGLRSERLFFEPEETSSILESKASVAGLPFKESVMLLSMESNDPVVDFRKSMEEMVEANGVKDWEGLEELLSWFLRVNGKSNHGYVVGAFVDLLNGLAISSRPCRCSCPPASSDHSPSSPLSFHPSLSASSSSTTACFSCLEAEEEPGTPSSYSSMLQVKKVNTGSNDDEASSSSSNVS